MMIRWKKSPWKGLNPLIGEDYATGTCMGHDVKIKVNPNTWQGSWNCVSYMDGEIVQKKDLHNQATCFDAVTAAVNGIKHAIAKLEGVCSFCWGTGRYLGSVCQECKGETKSAVPTCKQCGRKLRARGYRRCGYFCTVRCTLAYAVAKVEEEKAMKQ